MDKTQQFIIKCKKHPEHVVNFINLINDNQSEPSCDECVSEEGSSLKNYISIQTINVCKNDYVFSNWPPVNDSQLLKDIQSSLKSESLTVETLEQQFSELVIQITNKLNELKKKIIQQIVIQDEKKHQLLNSYNEISYKEKMKELVKFKEQTFQKQIQDLKSFILENQKKKEENTSFLKEQLQSFKQIQQNTIALPKQNLLNQIDLFCQIQKAVNDQQNVSISSLFGKSVLCNLRSSDQIQILENKNENKVSLISKEEKEGQVYFNYQLNKENNYVLRFKNNDEQKNWFLIGLVDENYVNADMNFNGKGKIFQHNNITYGGKVVQGNYFYELGKDSIIEMRIDIQNRQIQYLDYPHYQNINELNKDKELDSNKNYFLALRLHFKQQIDLIYFQETKNQINRNI